MTKKIRIRIWIVVVIISVMWFSDWSFAADQWDNFKDLAWTLQYIVSMLSWLWVFFAKLAWTFLTNQWVYWEELWLDALLWKFWNVIKNIANFCLWFYFVYIIFAWLIKKEKENIVSKLKKNILWLLVAWIWIQASWFFTAAIIDISTLTLSAAWSFPAQVISNSPYIQTSLEQSIVATFSGYDNWKEISFASKNAKSSSILESRIVHLDKLQTKTGWLDTLMPKPEDVAWPLYFIWFSILKTDVLTSIDSSSDKWLKKTIINTIIQWGTTVIFAIEMIALCVLALMRILYLWMFIVVSPLAVLIRCIENAREKTLGWDKSFLSKFTKQINFKTFFVNVFKPTFVVLWFWVALIFVSLMNGVILEHSWWRTFDAKWAKIQTFEDPRTNSNWEEWNWTYTSVLSHDFLDYTLAHAWKSLLQLVLSIITVMIVYYILSFAIKFSWWSDFVSSKMEWFQEWIGNWIGKMPILPVTTYDKNWLPVNSAISANKVFGLGSEQNLIERKIDVYQGGLDDQYQEQRKAIQSLFTKEVTWYLTDDERRKIEAVKTEGAPIDILKAKKNAIEKSKDWKWMTLDPNTASNNWFWIEQFEAWLENSNNKRISWTKYDTAWNNMINRWNDDKNKDGRTLEKMFKTDENNNVKAYADFFGLSLSSNTWEELKKADISKWTPSETS